MKKQILSALLCTCVLFGALPKISAASAGNVKYETKFPKIAIMNKAMADSESFFNSYVKTKGAFNNADKYGLDYNMKEKVRFVHNGGFNPTTNDSVTEKLLREGQLKLKITASMRGDEHGGSEHRYSWTKHGAYQYMRVRASDVNSVRGPSNDRILTVGDENYSDADYNSLVTADKQWLFWSVNYWSECGCDNCGSPKFSKPIAAFADKTGPKMTEYKVTLGDKYDSASYSQSASIPAEGIYIHFKFNEYIRFSDHSAAHDDVKLGLKLFNINTNQETQKSYNAKLYALCDDYITFRYVPDSELNNHYIGSFGSITDEKNQNCLNSGTSGNGNYTNKMFWKDKDMSTMTDDWAKKALKNYGGTMLNSTSLFTDIAGNPTQTTSPVAMNKDGKIYIDKIAPAVEKVSVEFFDSDFSQKNADTEDGVNRFVGPGRSAEISVVYSERINFNISGAKARLNIKDAAGNPVEVEYKSHEDIVIPNNPPDRTKITFKPLIITADMVGAMNGNGAGEAIRIDEIVIDELCDYRGNPSDDEAVILQPAQQFYLDTLSPVVKAVKLSGEGGVTPVDRFGADGFVFDFIMEDSQSHGAENSSDVVANGSSILTGSILFDHTSDAQTDNFAYTYAISFDGTVPSEQSFTAGTCGKEFAFVQMPASETKPISLYVKFPDEVLPNALEGASLSILCRDNAGNTVTEKFLLDTNELRNMTDRSGPVISLQSFSTKYDEASGTGTLEAKVKISDISGVDSGHAEYALPNKGAEPLEGDWKSISLSGDSDAEVVGDIVKNNIPNDEGTQAFDLYVRARDKANMPTQTVFGPKTMVYGKTYPKIEISADETAMKSVPMVQITGLGQSNGETEPKYSNAYVLLRPGNNYYFDNGEFSDPDTYIMRERTGDGEHLFTVHSANWSGEWSYVKLTSDGDGYTFTKPEESGRATEFASDIANAKFYGDVNIRFLIGYGIKADDNGSISCVSPIDDKSYTMHAVGMPAETGDADFSSKKKKYDIQYSIENRDALICSTEWSPNSDKSTRGSIYDLAGTAINVSITPLAMPDWGLSGINFEESFLSIVYWENNDEKELCRMPLSKSMHNRLVVPDGLSYPAGKQRHALKLFVTDAAEQSSWYHYESVNFTDYLNNDDASKGLFIDHSVISEFGLASYTDRVILREGLPAIEETINRVGYDDLNEQTYTNPERITLACHTDDNVLGYSHELAFTSRCTMKNREYIRVYNATDGLDATAMEKKTKWKGISSSATDGKFAVRFYDNAAEITALSEVDGEIPLIKGQDNLIVYYVMHDNGTVSAKRTLLIYANNDMAEPKLSLEPSESTLPTSVVYATFSGTEPGSELYRYRKNVAGYELISGNEALLDNEGESVFYVRDAAGNIAVLTANPSFLYLKKPVLSGSSVSRYDRDSDSSAIGRNGMMGANSCVYEAYLEQNDCIEKYGFKLRVAFNDEYAARLGGGAVFNIPPIEEWNSSSSDLKKYEWSPAVAQPSGIYYISITAYDTYYSIKFKLIHKYDESKGEATENISLKVSVSDIAGNISNEDIQTTEMANIMPEIKSIVQGGDFYPEAEVFNELSAIAVATVPIANVTPSVKTPKNGQGGFAVYANSGFWQRPSIGIYRDGDYQMTYTDIFGNQYEQTVKVDPFINEDGYDCGLDVLFSEPNSETGKVSMTVTALDDRFPLDIVQGEYGAGLIFEEHSDKWNVLKRKVTTATVELDPTKSLLLCRYNPKEYIENNRFVYQIYPAIVVREFVKTTPQAEIVWYFDEFGTNELPKLVLENGDEPTKPDTTTRNVTAFLQSDRLINGINGKDTTHTFTYGGETSYTFEFEDITGSNGSVTADLNDIPITILPPVAEPTDTEPPDYTMQVYAKYNGVLNSLNAYTNAKGVSNQSASPQKALTDISWTQGYLLNFELTDESAARLVIKSSGTGTGLTYSNASSDVIDGVSVSGTQVSIDKPADFDVVLIDASNNILAIPFSGNDYKFDLEPPRIGAIDKVQTGLYEVTAYVRLEDNVSFADAMTWIYPAGVKRITGGEHDGKFAVVFSGNSSIEARFADEVGNTGRDIITVDSLDDTAPAVTEVVWTPGNGEDTTAPPLHKVNTDVTALVKFNTDIKDLKISCENNSNPETYVSVLPQANSAIITFADNNYAIESGEWKLKLDFTAPNNKSGSHELTLGGIIDKTPPAVMVALTDEVNSPYAEIEFTGMNEDFYLAESGSKLYKQNETYKKVIDKKGIYTLRFIDAAGNISVETVEVKNIDDAPPLILLGELPQEGQWFKDSVTFKATMNEAGTILCNGKSYNIAAPTDRDGNGKFSEDECNWAEISVAENGGYKITATDHAGLATETYLAVRCIDNTAPVLQFAPTTLNIMQGTDMQYVMDLLEDRAHITVWDNNTSPEEIIVTAEAFDEQLLSRVGYHAVSYTAKDKAGNIGNGQRYLRIYSANEPQITLNGVKTFRDSVTILNSTDIKMSVSNLSGGNNEPYSVFLKQGRRTEGQMKIGSTLIDNSEFTVEKERFYTLYIVTQSRGTYLTNLYVH